VTKPDRRRRSDLLKLRLTPELKHQVLQAARHHGMSASEYARRALRDHLATDRKATATLEPARE
jgi:predicted HicB family RNase H-like nuclease